MKCIKFGTVFRHLFLKMKYFQALFFNLPSIFRENTVESSIPDYFENKGPSIICYINWLLILILILRLQIHGIVKIQNSVMNQQAILLQEI